MQNFELIQCANADELASRAAKEWLDEIVIANRMTAQHDVALSGGRITAKFLAAVVEQSRGRNISLGQVNFFWADERCVPPTDAQSNFKLVNEGLFAPLKIAADKIHRLRGEDGPEEGAKKAEAEIRKIVGPNAHGQPVLDLIFLGLGEDGHVASLAPEEPESVMQDQAVFRGVHNFAKPPPDRITIGYQTIAAARQVWMLASGTGKEQAFRDSLMPNGKTSFARVLKTARANEDLFGYRRLVARASCPSVLEGNCRIPPQWHWELYLPPGRRQHLVRTGKMPVPLWQFLFQLQQRLK